MDRRYALMWSATTTSTLGSGVAAVAAPLLVASRTSDPLMVSFAAAAAWLPWLFFALPGGVLVDRTDRRLLMIVLDLARVVAVGVLAVAVAVGRDGIGLILVVLFLIGTGEAVFRSAAQALVPAVVPREDLERGNGWLAGGVMLAQLLGGPLGGFLFAVGLSIPFFLNAGTYLASAVLIALLAGVYRAQATERRSVRAELAEGFSFLLRQRVLRTMSVLIGLLNVTLTAALAVLVLLARERLGLGPVGYGVLTAASAAGGVLGAAFGHRLFAAVGATWTIRVGLLVEAAFHLVLATSRSPWVVGAGFFAFGVHGSLWSIAAVSFRQRLTPPHLLGRVGSTNLFIAAGGNALGAVMGGALASHFGITAPYWVGFGAALAVSAATWHVFSRANVEAIYANTR
jgi:MFS family permease